MRILVAAAAYPTCDGKRPLYYVHSRNLSYRDAGMEVTVLNFAADKPYVYDGIPVITPKEFAAEGQPFDVLVCHAANLRNHFLFLLKYQKRFSKILFFFHGHEVLRLNRFYPKPYAYAKRKGHSALLQGLYDNLKLFVWRTYFRKNIDRVRLVFVSRWIFEHFLEETGLTEDQLKGRWAIISNGVGRFFEEHSYTPAEMETDFITIRNNFDGSTYCLDVVTKLARQHPEYRFLVIGKGRFFDHTEPPHNLKVLKTELSHSDMEKHLNAARYALMPIRQDTQGLMSCELATYGLPLITSDIEVCRMVFETCPHVAYIANDHPDLAAAVARLGERHGGAKWDQYLAKNTIEKEIAYIQQYANED